MKNVLLQASILSVCVGCLVSCGGSDAIVWSLPVPDAAQVVLMTALERDDAVIRLRTVDVPIEDADAAAGPVGRVGGLVVDDSGAAFVLDSSAGLIRTVGTPGLVFGGLGEGPGEFSAFAKQLAIADHMLVVADRLNARFSRWSVSGEHLGDLPFSPVRVLVRFEGLSDGAFFAEYLDPLVPGGNVVLARMDSEFRVAHEFVRGDATRGARFERDERVFGVSTLVEQPRLLASIAPGGALYVSPGDAYQVLRYDSTGTVEWAMAVAAEPEPISEPVKREALASYLEERRRTDPGFDLRYGEVEWPAHSPAVAALLVDRLERIWVFPFVDSTRLPRRQRPLDIYDASGRRLYSGYVELETDGDALSWPLGRYVFAGADAFYAVVRLSEDDEPVIRKYEYPVLR